MSSKRSIIYRVIQKENKVFSRSITKALALFALPLSLSISLSVPLAVQACGPFFDDAVFVYSSHPDAPLKLYVGGNLGLLQPTYARSYLVLAYRYLTDKPLKNEEIAGAMNLLSFRLGSQETTSEAAEATSDGGGVGVSLWNKARLKVAGAPKSDFDVNNCYKSIEGEDYSTFLNCGDDAFRTAAKTLESRIATSGADSKEVKEWLQAQDIVFNHCSGPGYNYEKKANNPEPPFPSPLTLAAGGAPVTAQQRQDRAYQIAAAKFYAGDFEVARSLFGEIARDSASPWHQIAAYMVARSLIRQGTLAKDAASGQKYLVQAAAKVQELAQDPSLSAFKESIEGLHQFILVRMDREAAFRSLTHDLLNGNTGNQMARVLGDYTYVLDRFFNESGDESSEDHKVDDKAAEKLLRSDDMADWIWTFSAGSDAANLEHARQMYNSKKSLPWLLCLADKVKTNDKDAASLIKALSAVPTKSAGYVHARYQLCRLTVAAGKKQEARALIDQALGIANLPPSAAAALKLLKVDTAIDLNDFVKLSFIAPAAVVNGWNTCEVPDNFADTEKKLKYSVEKPLLAPESAKFINGKLNLTSFLQAAGSAHVQSANRADFAQAAFVRSVLLGDFDKALKASALVKSALPASIGQMKAFETAVKPDEKRFAAVLFMLKNPGARPVVSPTLLRSTAFGRINDYQDNWWPSSGELYANSKLALPFANADAAAEITKMKALGAAPSYMGRVVVDYAKNHGSDSRVPEALHLVVKATRFGAGDSNNGKISTEAFRYLHKTYAGSTWTKQTPYHY